MPDPANARPSTLPGAEPGAWGRVRAVLAAGATVRRYLGVRTVLLFVLVVALPGGLLLLPFALASARKGPHPAHREPPSAAAHA